MVRALLAGGARADAVDSGYSALMLAARGGAEEAVAAVLEHGVPLGARSPDGWAARTLAVQFANHGVLRLLQAEQGVPLEARLPRKHGSGTALHASVANNYGAAAKALLLAGTDAGAADAAGRTPLEAARTA